MCSGADHRQEQMEDNALFLKRPLKMARQLASSLAPIRRTNAYLQQPASNPKTRESEVCGLEEKDEATMRESKLKVG